MKELKFSTRNAILDIYLNVRAYIADVFGGNHDDVTLDWNAVGACIHYFDNRCNIQFRLWEHSDGHLEIPDMTLIIINISFRGSADTIHSEMTAFVHWLQQTAISPTKTTVPSPPIKSSAAASPATASDTTPLKPL